VATLVVGGWWDQEDYYGALKRTKPESTTRIKDFVVLGPWNHGGWNGRARNLARLISAARPALLPLANSGAVVAYYLKARAKERGGSRDLPNGSNKWTVGPLASQRAVSRDLFLHSGKKTFV